MIVVASMFAGLHVYQYRQNIGAILSISLLSLVLTMIRARTGRLLPCFVIHLVFNGIQSLIIVLEPYLRTLLENEGITCMGESVSRSAVTAVMPVEGDRAMVSYEPAGASSAELDNVQTRAIVRLPQACTSKIKQKM